MYKSSLGEDCPKRIVCPVCETWLVDLTRPEGGEASGAWVAVPSLNRRSSTRAMAAQSGLLDIEPLFYVTFFE